jgi:hypothetical protein
MKREHWPGFYSSTATPIENCKLIADPAKNFVLIHGREIDQMSM